MSSGGLGATLLVMACKDKKKDRNKESVGKMCTELKVAVKKAKPNVTKIIMHLLIQPFLVSGLFTFSLQKKRN